ncbi:MAG TPA: hypothetical protein VGN44_05515 [Candidatus Angelobacter sp.]
MLKSLDGIAWKYTSDYATFRRKSLREALSGALYGIVLCVIGVIYAGAGHGSYFFVILASAPVWVLSFQGPFGVGISIAAVPVLWIGVGFLLNVQNKQKKKLFLALMLVHYVSAMVLLVLSHEEWKTPSSMLEMFGLIWYCFGQIAIWRTFLKNNRSTTLSETERRTTYQ